MQFTPAQQLRVGLLCSIGALWYGVFAQLNWALLWVVLGLIFVVIWQKWWTVVVLLAAVFIAYASWQVDAQQANYGLKSEVGREIELVGYVSAFPDARITSVLVNLQTDRGEVLVTLPPEAQVAYGDGLKVSGKLSAMRNFGGFDYRRYMARVGVRSQIIRPEMWEISPKHSSGRPLLLRAAETRKWISDGIRNAVPEPHATLALGVLAGVKDPLPSFTQSSFQRSGLTHLLVVSGVNVVYVTLLAYWLFGWAPRWVRFGVAVGFTLFYAAITGADAPIIRASIMGLIAGLATATGNMADSRTALLISLFGIGLWQPLMLSSDAGLHLSALATLGILVLYAPFKALLKWVPATFGLRTILAITLSAQVAVTPLLVLNFDDWAIFGLFANVLSEPLVPLLMLGGAIAAFGGNVLVPLWAQISGIFAYVIAEGLSLISVFISALPQVVLPALVAKIWLLAFALWAVWCIVRLAPSRKK